MRSHRQQKSQRRAKSARHPSRGQIRTFERGKCANAGGTRQMAGRLGRPRAGRAGPRVASPHRPHSRADRALRHPFASAHHRGGSAVGQGARAPQTHGGHMELTRVDSAVAIVFVAACARSTTAIGRFCINLSCGQSLGAVRVTAPRTGFV